MASFTAGTKKLYYETCGAGRPLVLIHGFLADGFNWLTVKDLLARHFTVVIPDNRFTGRSVAADEPAAAKDIARDIADLLEHLNIGKAVIAGHSMGGYVAQEFALAYPGRTESLIPESTASFTSARNKALFENFYRLLLAHGYDDVFWNALYAWILTPAFYDRPQDVLALINAARGYPNLSSPLQILRQVELMKDFDTRDRLANIAAPALVLTGEQDILIPAEEARALATAITNASFRTVKGAGHAIHCDQPDLFVKTVRNFAEGKLQ